MADVTLTVYQAARPLASAPNYTANKTGATSSNVYFFPNNGRVVLLMAAATTANVTIETPNTQDGNAIADLTLALANTNVRVIGPFPPAVYNDSQGRVKVTVDANTDLYAVRV